ncbi:MAG: hypothetical protein H8D56_07105 [Planctomycetes bacterium]|nr:hypothetical protein [Planctomycetota bacterium]
MENISNENASNKWLSVPLIATVTRLLCRELTLQNEYLKRENKILKSKIKKRIVFTDDERKTLVESAIAMGKDLMEQIGLSLNPKQFLPGNEDLKMKNGTTQIVESRILVARE